MTYLLHIIIVIEIYAILAISLDLVVGRLGLLSVAHAAFYAVGAYASAVLCVYHGCSFVSGAACGMGFAIVASLVVSIPAVRLRDDYLVIATLACQLVVSRIIENWMEVTRGPLGIAGIPQPIILGWSVDSPVEFVALAGGCGTIVYLVVSRLTSGPLGRLLIAIREDELFARSLGKNTAQCKVFVYAISAALAALGGSLYAHYVSYIDPTSFSLGESILILAMIIIGGAGSLMGPVIGAVVLVTLPELLRFAGFPNDMAAGLRQFIYGAALITLMLVRPRGLVGRYGFDPGTGTAAQQVR